jgi:hypothetical protein
MNQSEIRENIASLLEQIMQRSLEINNSKGRDMLLEIDLVMEDMRELYRQYHKLKNIYQNHQQDEQKAMSAGSPPEASAEVTQLHQQIPSIDAVMERKPQQEKESEKQPEEMPREVPQPPSVEPKSEPEMEPVSIPEFEPEKTPEPGPDPKPRPDPDEPMPKPYAGAAQQEHEHHQKPVPDTIFQEQPVEIKKPVHSQSPPEAPGPEPDPAFTRPAAQRSVIDLFSEPTAKTVGENYPTENNSLHQQFSKSKPDQSVGSRMQQMPISNIRDAIGINDKFLFINELFHGNIQSYNEAINKLNSFEDAQPAFDYIDELSRNYSWDNKRSEETIKNLKNFVRRRYQK